MKGLHPMHFTEAHNLPRVACDAPARGKRRTTKIEDLRNDRNPCPRCIAYVENHAAKCEEIA